MWVGVRGVGCGLDVLVLRVERMRSRVRELRRGGGGMQGVG